jgi:hypothetical protein
LKTVAEIPDAQDKTPLDVIAQLPLEDFSVKPLLTGVTVKVAQVPEVYHVPPEMIQPLGELLPLGRTLRKPLPEKEPEPPPPEGAVEVGWAAVVVVVVG